MTPPLSLLAYRAARNAGCADVMEAARQIQARVEQVRRMIEAMDAEYRRVGR